LICFFAGVSYDEANLTKPWRAQITITGQKKHLGYYLTELEAAKSYDSAAVEHHGNRAVLNFDGTKRVSTRKYAAYDSDEYDLGDGVDSLSSNSTDSEDERLEQRLRSVMRKPKADSRMADIKSGLSSDEEGGNALCNGE